MTSKERVRRAIEHRETDRVALEYRARDEVSRGLRARFGLDSEEALLRRFGVDLRRINPRFSGPTAGPGYADPTVRVDEKGIHYDIWGVGFKASQTPTGAYMDLAYSPLRNLSSMDELDAYPWPTADLWDYANIPVDAERFGEYWVWGHSRGILENSWFLRGFDEFMMDLVAEPERACRVLDHVLEYLMTRTKRILEAGHGLVDMIEYNDDVGGQTGLLISPEMWRAFIKPRMAAFIGLAKSYDVKIQYHSCGGVRPIIADLIEIGVDVLNPVQTLAEGMAAEGLKCDFGDFIAFNGGIDTQRLLPYASPKEVASATRRLIDTLGDHGGLILAPAHRYQADVPLDNVVAIYETALNCLIS